MLARVRKHLDLVFGKLLGQRDDRLAIRVLSRGHDELHLRQPGEQHAQLTFAQLVQASHCPLNVLIKIVKKLRAALLERDQR